MTDRLDDLRALREQLLRWMADAPVDKKAPLIAQYRATLAEIDALDEPEVKGDGVDEIAQRRADRRQRAAKGASRSRTGS